MKAYIKPVVLVRKGYEGALYDFNSFLDHVEACYTKYRLIFL